GDVAASIVALSSTDLSTTAATTLDDALRQVTGFSLFRRSGSRTANPTSQGVSLRGVGASGASRAVVIADGVPLNDPFGGWVYWRAVPLLAIDRIEIVPGGASALFGDFGLGGAVQLVSRPIDGDRLEAVLAGGSLGTGRAAVRATARAAGFGVALGGEAFPSGGCTPTAAPDAVAPPASGHHGRG